MFAEILAHNDRFTQAAAEVARAHTIDPSPKFSDPGKVRACSPRWHTAGQPGPVRLGRSGHDNDDRTGSPGRSSRRSNASPHRLASAGMDLARGPRGGGLSCLANAEAKQWRRRYPGRREPRSGVRNGRHVPGRTPGGGLMGVGLAAAGGVAAGMLAEKLLERGHEQRGNDAFNAGPFDGASGSDADACALEDRSVDFGTGNDWSDGGGSVDVGGGSDDGGGW